MFFILAVYIVITKLHKDSSWWALIRNLLLAHAFGFLPFGPRAKAYCGARLKMR